MNSNVDLLNTYINKSPCDGGYNGLPSLLHTTMPCPPWLLQICVETAVSFGELRVLHVFLYCPTYFVLTPTVAHIVASSGRADCSHWRAVMRELVFFGVSITLPDTIAVSISYRWC
jgi:hypothetical protein